MSAQRRAADLAAQQVETIVNAAQEAADRIKDEGRREIAELRRSAVKDADEIRAAATRDADRELEDARKKAIQLADDARREADVRVGQAQTAADEVLAEARAVSTGLRQLAASLTEQAGRILREVEAGHRRMNAELRAPAGGSPAARPPRRRQEPAPSSPARENPFDDLDVPSWLS